MSPGRPPLPPDRRRTIRKEVRFSEAEYDRLCLTALKMRMDVSRLIRVMVLPEFERAGVPVRIKYTDSTY